MTVTSWRPQHPPTGAKYARPEVEPAGSIVVSGHEAVVWRTHAGLVAEWECPVLKRIYRVQVNRSDAWLEPPDADLLALRSVACDHSTVLAGRD